MEPQPADPPASTPEVPDPPADIIIPPPEADAKPDRHSSSSSSSSSRSRGSSVGIVLNLDAGEMSTLLVTTPPDDDDDATANAGPGAAEVIVAKPDDWVSWPESPPKAIVDTALVGPMTQAPGAQTMAKPDNGGVGGTFNPDRIPASIFQAKQAEWSITSNESLFSIHGASHSQSDDFYNSGGAAASRSHFDHFYDEAMAAGGGEQPGWRMPALEEVAEGGAMPGSGGSDDSSQAKKAMAFRRHESGSAGSSSNFSFAFPILAETSPRKKESVGGYQQLRKEYDQSLPATPVDRKLAFEEMTTEEERRRRKPGWCGCGECCCGCCWIECPAWSSCCCCCQWRWRCCSCPSFCRCTCCL
ncbi:hypothetical protein BRADI_2g05798v3 [Brachypodium distachyon]|uniref:Uncharacterized protein n=2 Tax=Brachypodium distachyon TaxID=15368 RepID=A0A0Q3IBA2_BRADI|nr:hypothetical protein BRADI_2g05798v3 [Brachypodium distachyon]